MSEEMNYPNNSLKARAAQNEQAVEEKKVEKVVSGKATTKKKNGITKFTDVFISSDINNVKSYVFTDLLIPAAKKLIYETITTSVDMILYGEVRHGKKNSSSNSRTSYGRYYERDREERDYERRARTIGYEFDEIVLDSRGDAEELLLYLEKIIDDYGMVSVFDMYDSAGITSKRHADRNYGWTNIATARVIPVRDGYLLRMPQAKSLN